MDLVVKWILELLKSRKVTLWSALAIALVALLAFLCTEKLGAIETKLTQHIDAGDRQVRLLEIMCTAVVRTDTEKKACEVAARK